MRAPAVPQTSERLPLSPRQWDTLGFIMLFIEAHGFPPSVREIMAGIGVTSTSTVHTHLNGLTRKGYIEWPLGRLMGRAYRVAGFEVRLLERAS